MVNPSLYPQPQATTAFSFSINLSFPFLLNTGFFFSLNNADPSFRRDLEKQIPYIIGTGTWVSQKEGIPNDKLFKCC